MTCNQILQREGKSYPRTCADCGLGPCKNLSKTPIPKAQLEALAFIRDPGTHWDLSEVIEVLTRAYEYFDNKSDAEILPDGINANPEMRLARETKHALEYIEHLRKELKGIAK